MTDRLAEIEARWRAMTTASDDTGANAALLSALLQAPGDIDYLLAEVERLRRVEEAQQSGGVTYREHNPDYGGWECSGCGNAWEFTNDGPAENAMNFCSRCGRPIAAIEPYRYPGEDGSDEAAEEVQP